MLGCKRERILARLRAFGYSSSTQMQEAVGEADELNLPQFELPPAVVGALSALVTRSKSVFRQPPRAPEIGPVNDWIRSRSQALVRQMALPLNQRSAFVLTPRALRARMGRSPAAAFEPFSIAELLFSDSNGEVAPMPFASCGVDLTAESPSTYCIAVFRRFAAQRLLTFGYEAASDVVLDILADVVRQEVKRIARSALVIHQGTQAETGLALRRALEVSGYDT
jgi:hypothetical protein